MEIIDPATLRRQEFTEPVCAPCLLEREVAPIDALIGGTLHGAPKTRTSQNGNPYTTAVVRAACRDGTTIFVSVITFSRTAGAALQALNDGDAVALAGELTPKVYVPQSGEPRPSLDLLAHQVMTAYHVGRKRKTVADQENQQQGSRGEPPFDDVLLEYGKGGRR